VVQQQDGKRRGLQLGGRSDDEKPTATDQSSGQARSVFFVFNPLHWPSCQYRKLKIEANNSIVGVLEDIPS
jgi:hypothetical protein